MLKKSLTLLYIVVVAVMAIATFVEHATGTRLYDAWWFTALWALLAAVAIVYFLKRRVRRLSVVALHLSFVLILLGALLTHLTARSGAIHLRAGDATSQYATIDGRLHPLPFSLRLDSFVVRYHEGTTTAADYESHLSLTDDEGTRPLVVSMNQIGTSHSVRLYQSSFDDDGRGTVLSVNRDPWGIPVTYAGYALLFISLVWMLIDPRGQYRQVLRAVRTANGEQSGSRLAKALVLFIFLSPLTSHFSPLNAAPVLPKETADHFGQLLMLYNGRICPVETYALDFTKKLYGKRHYGDLTACQVLTGFIFYGDEWSEEPILRLKSGELKDARQLPDYCTVNHFFRPGVGYVLGPYVQEYYQGGQHDGFHKQVAKVDDQLMMVMDLRQGTPLKLFPYTPTGGATRWYSPTERIDTLLVPAEQRQYISEIFTLLYQEVLQGNFGQVDEYLSLMQKHQQEQGARSLPSSRVLWAERVYNAVPFATILFMLNLTMGFLALAFFIWIAVSQRKAAGWIARLMYAVCCLSFAALTFCEALRWTISGNIPMSNGYETMLLMAWFILLITLLLYRRFRILLCFGFLLSGFFLLVSHISQMDPQIGRLMPVLRSPLLTLHVSIIMMSFALLSLTFICGLTALVLHLSTPRSPLSVRSTTSLALLSRVFLYPALTTLGLGIFIGAIWANISWGTYWSWDPKEVWALITFMVYAVAVHERSFPLFRRPLAYHLYVTLAFLTILMTYFGVNYFLGGMHSYA